MNTIVKHEPAYIITTITAFLVAAFGLAATFGFNVSEETQKALFAMVSSAVALIFVLGPIIRQYVTPVAKAEEKIDEAFHADPAVDEKPKL